MIRAALAWRKALLQSNAASSDAMPAKLTASPLPGFQRGNRGFCRPNGCFPQPCWPMGRL